MLFALRKRYTGEDLVDVVVFVERSKSRDDDDQFYHQNKHVDNAMAIDEYTRYKKDNVAKKS